MAIYVRIDIPDGIEKDEPPLFGWHVIHMMTCFPFKCVIYKSSLKYILKTALIIDPEEIIDFFS